MKSKNRSLNFSHRRKNEDSRCFHAKVDPANRIAANQSDGLKTGDRLLVSGKKGVFFLEVAS
jgi:hypothetical protein